MRSPRCYPGSKEDDQSPCAKQGSSGTMARFRRFFKISLGGNSLKGTNQTLISRRSSHLTHSSRQLILSLKQEAAEVIGRPLEDLIMGQNKLDSLGIPIFLHNLCCHIINCGVDYDALLSDDWCPKQARTVIFEGGENSGTPIGITEEMFVATSLLRLFLSELPQPLLQWDVILTLIELCKDTLNSEFDNEIDGLLANQIKSVLLEKLPNHNFRLMEYLSAFLHQLDMAKADLCRVSAADLCMVLGRAIAKSSCYDGTNVNGSCRVVQIIFLNYETIFNDESQTQECNSYAGCSKSDSDRYLYDTDVKSVDRSADEDSTASSNSSDDFCLPVVSPLKDFGRSIQFSEPRSSREVSDTEKTYAKSQYLKDSFRSITDLLSSPGDSSRDEGVRYSSHDYKEWTSQLSGDSSGLSDDSSIESEAARDADRSDVEGASMVRTICPHEEKRSSERFCPGPFDYDAGKKSSKTRRKVKRKHSKASMTKDQPSTALEMEGAQALEDPRDANLDQEVVQPFTDLLKSSEPVTSNRGDDMRTWGLKMSHTDNSHRTTVMYNRSEEENTLFGSPCDSLSNEPFRSSPGQTAIKHVTKTISSLKKKIKHFEESFEKTYSYKPSHSEKMRNRDIRPLMSEINKLRKELKKMKEESAERDSANTFNFGETFPEATDRAPERVQTLRNMENVLHEQRKDANRPDHLVDMTSDEIQEEKTQIQRVLLYYEHLHGRPNTKEDRNLARPLYDRYREVKRTIVRSSSRTKDNIVELAPILENEAMDFTLASPQHRGSLQDEDETREQESLLQSAAVNADPHPDVLPSVSDIPKTNVNIEDLHALPSNELKNRKKIAKEAKKMLRQALKEFEERFERENGRRVQKEDRGPMEQTYKNYKHAKAKVKLLEALLVKYQDHGV